MIGFLNPQGELIKCSSWEHLDKSTEICKDVYNKEFIYRQDAEDYILSVGYVAIRARDVYMSYKNETTNEWIKLTQKQLDFFATHADEFNEAQKKDICEILYYQEGIRKRN